MFGSPDLHPAVLALLFAGACLGHLGLAVFSHNWWYGGHLGKRLGDAMHLAHGLLGRWGCVVETARDGREALTMARLGTYDAILADIRLPDVGGYDIYRGLREAQPQARVILMTGYGYDPGHAIVKARLDGLRHVLFKPFRVDQLLSALSSPDPAGPAGALGGPGKDGPPVASLSGGPRPAS